MLSPHIDAAIIRSSLITPVAWHPYVHAYAMDSMAAVRRVLIFCSRVTMKKLLQGHDLYAHDFGRAFSSDGVAVYYPGRDLYVSDIIDGYGTVCRIYCIGQVQP